VLSGGDQEVIQRDQDCTRDAPLFPFRRLPDIHQRHAPLIQQRFTPRNIDPFEGFSCLLDRHRLLLAGTLSPHDKSAVAACDHAGIVLDDPSRVKRASDAHAERPGDAS
jgi:hypothetical protein